jgi:hypothetical protein
MQRRIKKFREGQVIVELLVAFGLSTILLPAILTGFASSRGGQAQQGLRLRAIALAREAVEVTRNVRDSDWTNISTNGNYYPRLSADCVTTSGSTWRLCPGSQTVEDFTRVITISDADPVDPSLKKIDVNVSWNNIIASSISESFYLARWKNINSSITTTGTLVNQASGDWCAPSLNLGSLDLPKSGVANAVSAIQGQIAAGTGDNASGVSYANVSITDPEAPATPSASIVGTFDGYKTNDVYTEQNFAYLATDNNGKEVVIVDLTNISGGKYAEAGYFNAPGNGNANSIATNGNVGYMVGGSKIYSFDLTSKSGSRTALDSDGLTLPGTALRLMIVGSRAYVLTTSTSSQLVVVNIANPNNMSIVRQIQLNGLAGAALYVNSDSTRAYVATRTSSTQRELFIVNIDESSGGFGGTVNSYDTNGMDPKGVILVNIPRVVVVGTGGEEYQVINVTDETGTLTRCGGIEVNSGVNAIATVFTAAQRAYSYIVTGDANTELKLIEGGPGGSGSGGGLTVDSPALDAGHSSNFNRISITDLSPAGISATYRVAVSPDCVNYNFVGNYDTTGGAIPNGINPGQCFKYRVTFSGGSEGTSTNVSTTVSVNYSP